MQSHARKAAIRNSLVALLLSAGTVAAHADWVRVATSQQSVFYVDSAKSPRVGNNVMIWVLRDHRMVQLGQAMLVMSSKDQIEIDCAGRRVRRIFSSDHPRHMGKGRAVHSEHGPMSWNAASPDTTISRIVDVACANT
jgi:hypothetical protein